MARFGYLIFFLLLTSCAQLGTITGGSRDTSAPKPTEKGSTPNGSTLFSGDRITLTFDEYFRLNDPGTTIKMVPPHARIQTQVKGKTLMLTLDGTLEPSTTYAIYFNRTIKDLTEGNDSIMQFVFSTGTTIDTLSYTVALVDAFSNEPIKNGVVALFDEQNRLVNFAQSDAEGKAVLRYLNATPRTLVAFVDDNKDLVVQTYEKVGFPADSLVLPDSSALLKEVIRLFAPTPKPTLRAIETASPGLIKLGATSSLEDASFFFNDVQLGPSDIRYLSKDSVHLFGSIDAFSEAEIVTLASAFTDTSLVRILETKKHQPVVIQPEIAGKNAFPSGATVAYWLNDAVVEIDTARITLSTKSNVTFSPQVTVNNNQLTITLPETQEVDSLNLRVESGALRTRFGANDSYNASLIVQPLRKFGSLSVNLTAYSSPVILWVIQAGKIIKTLSVQNPQEIVHIELLEPGDYSFRVVRDENANEQWDTGDFELRIQPEWIDTYSTVTKVRANWNVEVSLEPNADEESAE